MAEVGHGVWLDWVGRDWGLETLIAEDGLTGVTSNPSIVERARGRRAQMASWRATDTGAIVWGDENARD